MSFRGLGKGLFTEFQYHQELTISEQKTSANTHICVETEGSTYARSGENGYE